MASKRSRASGEQLNAMVDFMTQNPVFAGGKFAKLHGKQENEQKWAELSDNLNGLGGAFKTIDQWQNGFQMGFPYYEKHACLLVEHSYRKLFAINQEPNTLKPL